LKLSYLNQFFCAICQKLKLGDLYDTITNIIW
jgi:hypothetical protein